MAPLSACLGRVHPLCSTVRHDVVRGENKDMASTEPREEMIAVGGTKVYTLVGGRGDPLVVLHGAGGPQGWRRWMATLAERFTI